MSRCQYSIKYFDYDLKEPKLFHCSEDSHESRFCIFHDEKFEDNDELVKKFSSYLSSIDDKKPVFFIGFHIPAISIKRSFSKPVYFTRTKIHDANFSSSTFEHADFSGSTFQNVDFSRTKFENSQFLAVKFNGKANFSNSVLKNANFSDSFFNDANFSESTLNKGQFLGTKIKNADFSNSHIEDSDFYGVVFENEVSFIGSTIWKK